MPSKPATTPAQSTNFFKQFCWLFVCLFTLLLLAHFADYFQIAYHVKGDEAVNALQIIKARAWQEIHGHYSRWGFHHPGPAFFYLYGWGEWLFFDLLKVVPTPDNAHFLTSLLIQSSFLAASLAIAARWSVGRWFLPLSILLAAIHFGLAGNAFYTVWPPHTLLFPFLCFVLACAALAAGDGRLLPLVCLAGGLLVHAHVAQPLFVLPLFLLAYAALAGSLGPSVARPFWLRPWRAWPRYHWLALCLLLIFLLPLLLDLSPWADSNLYAIWRYWHSSENEPKTWRQGALYLLSFATYQSQPELYVTSLSRESLTFLGERWGYLLFWLVALLLPFVWWGRALWRCRSERLRGIRWLYLLWLLAGLLTAVWSLLQSGVMFQFNSYFNFAILFVPLLLLALLADELLPVVQATWLQVAGATAVIALSLIIFHRYNFYVTKWNPQPMTAVLAADEPRTNKYLSFAPSDWGLAAGIALELKRTGYDFSVASDWAYVFGADQIVPQPPELQTNPPSIWHLVATPTDLPTVALTNQTAVYLPLNHLSQLDPGLGEIHLGAPNSQLYYQGLGWSRDNHDVVWNVDYASTLIFRPLPTEQDVRLTITASPYLAQGRVTGQHMTLYFNGQQLDTFFVEEPQTVEVIIPAELWVQQPIATLLFAFPEALPLRALGISEDNRPLAFAFSEITFSLTRP